MIMGIRKSSSCNTPRSLPPPFMVRSVKRRDQVFRSEIGPGTRLRSQTAGKRTASLSRMQQKGQTF